MPSGHGLAIKKGDTWAFRESARLPLVAAHIVNQPPHYEASITIRLVDSPERGLMSVRRVKLPCRWDDVDKYLDSHPDIPRELPRAEPQLASNDVRVPIDAAAEDLFSLGELTLRRIIRDELVRVVGTPRLALSYQDASAATGYSASVLRMAVARGDLNASHANSKPVFLVSELQRWLESLPPEWT
jgi:hypothetical protein